MWVANAFGSMQTDVLSSQQRASTFSMFSRHDLRLNLNHLGWHHRWSRLKGEVLPWPHSRRNGGRLNALRGLHLQLLSGTCSGRHRHHDALTRDAHGTGGHEGHDAGPCARVWACRSPSRPCGTPPARSGRWRRAGHLMQIWGASAGGFPGILNLKPGFVSNRESPNIVS